MLITSLPDGKSHSGDRIDREQKSARQLYDWRRSDWRGDREEFRKQRVEHAKGIWIRKEARDFDDAGEAASCVLEHGLQIQESLSRLRLKAFAGNISRDRIDSRLA